VRIAGASAVVTGSAHGIGRAVAQRLAGEGASVLVVDIDEEAGRDVVDLIRRSGGKASFLHADVTVEADVAEMISHAEESQGGLDVVVNNAGGYDQPVFPHAPLSHWSRTLDLNLRSVMLATHHAVPSMLRRGSGAIVNIASSAGLGLAPHPGPEYAVAKAGVIRLTACLAPLAERGIRVNCACPHTVATEGVRRTIAELTEAGEPLPRDLSVELIQLAEMAQAVVDLASDDALAGRVLVLRGGSEPTLLPVVGHEDV
jgi:NAD(P)-dependent dehydrogenase (short-subunit alcohol dehydrogenase family)